MTTTLTIITEDPVSVPGRVEGERLFVDVASLEAATGWERKPQGLCRGEICVPLRSSTAIESDGGIDIEAMAQALGRRVVVAPAEGIAAMSGNAEDRRAALTGLQAPDFHLPDLAGIPRSLSDAAGRKRLVVVFSSWCGCRYDLPGWQALADELRDDGLSVLLVALDDSADDVRPFTDDITEPVLLDSQHLLSELYAVSNVPTVIWIDEAARIVRPNIEAFGTDTFAEITGVSSAPQLDAIRRWVREGELPLTAEAAAGAVEDLSDDEIDARLHFRVGAEARRQGRSSAAERHLRRAGELAPLDFSVRRAAMPLLGEDPFGEDFLELYAEWREKGSPYHGLSIERD